MALSPLYAYETGTIQAGESVAIDVSVQGRPLRWLGVSPTVYSSDTPHKIAINEAAPEFSFSTPSDFDLTGVSGLQADEYFVHRVYLKAGVATKFLVQGHL